MEKRKRPIFPYIALFGEHTVGFGSQVREHGNGDTSLAEGGEVALMQGDTTPGSQWWDAKLLLVIGFSCTRPNCPSPDSAV